MNRRALTAATFSALALFACKENYGAGKSIRASDAGFEYRVEERTVVPELDAGLGPRLELVVGRIGGQGTLDGAGIEARLGEATGGACVGSSVWVADDNLRAFRQVDLASGAVTTVRTRWEPALPVDFHPWQVVSDNAEHLFVSDRTHHIIVDVSVRTATARIIAGKPDTRGLQDGSAAEALFDNPGGLALTPANDLYVADTGNHAIRKIDLKTGKVSTVATGFHAVWGLAWAGDAGLFATDPLIDALVHIDVASGKTDIVAGGHHSGLVGYQDGLGRKARFWRPGGLAYLPKERALYVSDRDNGLVRRLSLDTMTVDTVAGRPLQLMHEDGVGQAAGFFNLGFVSACGDAMLIVGDDGSLRRIEAPSGRVTTLAGMPPHPGVRDGAYALAQLNLPEDGVLVDANTMVLAECAGSDLRIVDVKHSGISSAAGLPYVRGFVDGVGDKARFNCPSALAHDGKSTIYVADRDNHAIRAFHFNTHDVHTVAGTISICGKNDGAFATATMCAPSGLAFVDGMLYVSDAGNHTVRRFDLQKQIVTTVSGLAFAGGAVDGIGDKARLSSPSGMAALPDGSLVVADREAGVLRKIDPRSGATTTLACPGVRFDRPRAVSAVGEVLLVTDRSAVHAFDPRTCKDTVLVGASGSIGVHLGSLPQTLNEPSAARYFPGTGLIILDRAENAVLRATVDGSVFR